MQTDYPMTHNERAAAINQLANQAAICMVGIGQHLQSVYQQMTDLQFADWVKQEQGWSIETARVYMRIAQSFGGVDFSSAHCSPDALKLLGHMAVSEDTRQTAARVIARGYPLTKDTAKSILSPAEFAVAHGPTHTHHAYQDRPTPRPYIPVAEQPRPAEAVNLESSTLGRLVMALQVALANDYGTPLRGNTARALAELQRAIQDQA